MYASTFFAALLSASAMIAPSVAEPIPDADVLAKRIFEGTQKCEVTKNAFSYSFNIDVGALYRREYCDQILDALHRRSIAVTNWQCEDDNANGFRLNFDTPAIDQAVDDTNIALGMAFQNIKFTCPYPR